MQKKKLFVLSFYFFLLFGIGACDGQSRTEKKLQPTRAAAQDFEGSLVFNDVTLEQADQQGHPLWKVNAQQAVYSKNKKLAKIQSPIGDYFLDGKKVYHVTAQSGQVDQDGQQVFLNGNIVVTDVRNGAVLRGNESEWRPKEDLLIVRNNMTGTYGQTQVSCKEGRYFSRTQQMELFGQVVATSKDPALVEKATLKAQEAGNVPASVPPGVSSEVPTLQMKTEHLLWQIPQKMVMGDKRIQIDKYKGKTLSEQAFGDRAEVNLQTKTGKLTQNVQLNSIDPPVQMFGNSVIWNYTTRMVTADQPVRILHQKEQATASGDRAQVDLERKVAQLQQNVLLTSVDPPIQIVGNSANWNYETKMVESDQPVRIVHQKEQVTVTGNRGQVDLEQKVAVLIGGAQGFASRNQAKLYANQITWQIVTQQVQADGNVIYQQVKPPLHLTGPTAFGKLQDQNIVITSNSGSRVVTEIIP